jgi:radical SAM superfamily enzyme YgiQ (UPF0313 family)
MKLGLVAISGVRVENPELTALGLTLPGLVDRGNTVAALPSLGLLTLAGLTPREIELDYLEMSVVGDPPEPPGEFDAVAISSFSARIKDAYRLADHYRSLGVKVILGGLHVTALPEEARLHADAVVAGEGELSWPYVLRDLQRGTLRPLYDSRSRSFDLAGAPLPRYELLAGRDYNRLTVQTQRGCPYRCEFCAASLLISPVYKLKPVEKVVAEVRHIKEIFPQPFIELADDNTFVSKERSKRLARALAAEKVRWFTETDVSVAEDEELLGLLRDAGCAQVLIGFESPLLEGLEGIERRRNWKARQRDRYLAAIRKIQSYGITVNGCFILGLDGTGPESFDQVGQFVRDSGLFDVQITVQTAFPGTPLYERLHREGRILRDGAWELCTLFDVNFRPRQMSVEALENGFRDLVVQLYSAEETRRRRRSFRNLWVESLPNHHRPEEVFL